jgi:hypothetical protein
MRQPPDGQLSNKAGKPGKEIIVKEIIVKEIIVKGNKN